MVSDYLTENGSFGWPGGYLCGVCREIWEKRFISPLRRVALLCREVLTLLKNIKDMDISMLLDYIRKLQEDNLDLYECLDFMQLW